MLAIKLKMAGRRNQRTFRVVVQEARSKLRGKFVEDVGWYNPHVNQFLLKKDRIDYWVARGAQPTESVEKLLKKSAGTGVAETYVAREGRKKKKGSKGGDVSSPEISGAAPEVESEEQKPASTDDSVNTTDVLEEAGAGEEAEEQVSGTGGEEDKKPAEEPAPSDQPEDSSEAPGEEAVVDPHT